MTQRIAGRRRLRAALGRTMPKAAELRNARRQRGLQVGMIDALGQLRRRHGW